MLSLLLMPALFAAASFEAGLIFPPNPLHNHSSSIVETPGGDLLAVWFHGTGERWADDVLLQGARLKAGDREWSEPFVMADTPDLPDCNPVLFIDPHDTLWLIWIVVQDNQWGGSLLKYRTSRDYEGAGPPVWDWQDVIHARPRELEERVLTVVDEGVKMHGALIEQFMPEMRARALALRERAQDKLHRRLGWMPRTPPIMLNDGATMMLGLYSDVFNCSLAAFTRDGGATWRFSTPILDPDIAMLGNIQPAFAQRRNGDIVAFMRDNGLPKQVRWSLSEDGGDTWSPIQITGIPNSGSSVDVRVLRSGAWALVCNDLMLGRHRLTMYLSDDEGRSWNVSRVIEEAAFDAGNFSYPTLIQTRDDALHVSYSYRRKDIEGSAIKHARFTEAWIRAAQP